MQYHTLLSLFPSCYPLRPPLPEYPVAGLNFKLSDCRLPSAPTASSLSSTSESEVRSRQRLWSNLFSAAACSASFNFVRTWRLRPNLLDIKNNLKLPLWHASRGSSWPVESTASSPWQQQSFGDCEIWMCPGIIRQYQWCMCCDGSITCGVYGICDMACSVVASSGIPLIGCLLQVRVTVRHVVAPSWYMSCKQSSSDLHVQNFEKVWTLSALFFQQLFLNLSHFFSSCSNFLNLDGLLMLNLAQTYAHTPKPLCSYPGLLVLMPIIPANTHTHLCQSWKLISL
jgi:hypothetical protein